MNLTPVRTAFWRSSAVTVLSVMILPAASVLSQTPRVRDSAGVRIVENGLRAAAPIAFTLSPTSISDIGGLKTDPADELTDWIVSFNVVRLGNGTRVVGDLTRVRYFDASGKQFKVVGREGRGPREFLNTSSICSTAGDTVVVWDGENRRVSIWTGDGDYVRQFPVERGTERIRCFDDGTILLATWQGQQLRLEHRRLDGAVIKALGTFGGAPPRTRYYSVQTSLAAHGTRFYIGDPRAHEVKGFDQQGKLVSIVRTADAIAKVTASEADAMIPVGGAAAGTSGGGGNAASTQRPAGPTPAEWPAYDEIRLDESGRLWIEEFRKTRNAPSLWTAFDVDGRMLGKFTMPARTKRSDPHLLAFTNGGALVRREDDDGAVHLVEYRLVRK